MNIDSISFLLNHDIFIFGFAPVLAYILGYLCTVIPLEFLIHTGGSVYDKYGLTYLKKDGSRIEALKRTTSRVALSTQVKTVVNVLIGPTAIVNGIFGYFLLSYVIPYEKRKAPSLLVGMMQFLLLEVIGDFFLYWGHRIQHEIPYLWKNFHSLHHSLETPSPIGTLYIDHVDATLQGALPMIFAALLCKPNLPVLYLYIYARIAENVVNHSGLTWPLLDLLFLKRLPLRASIAHHDAHHRFSNYAANAKNYGENFWVWDWLFGTLRGGSSS